MNLNFAVLFLVRKMTAELMEEKNIYILDVSPLHLGSLYRCPWLEIYMQHARHIFAARWIYIYPSKPSYRYLSQGKPLNKHLVLILNKKNIAIEQNTKKRLNSKSSHGLLELSVNCLSLRNRKIGAENSFSSHESTKPAFFFL